MDSNQTFYCTFLDKKSRSKFLCCTRRKNGAFNICLTDVSTVWSADCTEDTVKQCRQTFALRPTEENLHEHRSACSVVVHATSAELCGGPGPADLRVNLSRLEAPQATEELKELLFSMADSLSLADSASGFSGPVKLQQRRPPGVLVKKHLIDVSSECEPQQSLAPPLKKRPAGASLINPGAKKKGEAAGVSFDDADDL